jgi:hypothetical protein
MAGGENMIKTKSFMKSEVQSFLELRIIDDMATEEELDLYEEFTYTGKLNASSNTYKQMVRKMKQLWEEKY